MSDVQKIADILVDPEGALERRDRAGQRIVERNIEIAPTIRVRPGFPVRALVHKDLVLRLRKE